MHRRRGPMAADPVRDANLLGRSCRYPAFDAVSSRLHFVYMCDCVFPGHFSGNCLLFVQERIGFTGHTAKMSKNNKNPALVCDTWSFLRQREQIDRSMQAHKCFHTNQKSHQSYWFSPARAAAVMVALCTSGCRRSETNTLNQ